MVGNIGILYEDPYILVCRKPAGVPVQSANSRVKDMVSILKLYLLEESGKPGEPYLGVVHRLDQPVQGVIVFAKTKQAAANLSSQIADRKGSGQVVKRYCAVVRRNADVYKETETAAEYQELTETAGQTLLILCQRERKVQKKANCVMRSWKKQRISAW